MIKEIEKCKYDCVFFGGEDVDRQNMFCHYNKTLIEYEPDEISPECPLREYENQEVAFKLKECEHIYEAIKRDLIYFWKCKKCNRERNGSIEYLLNEGFKITSTKKDKE